MDTLSVGDEIRIPLTDIKISAVRAQGAGGQNVNKVATAVHLRFDSQRCTHLPEYAKQQLLALRDHRINDAGVIIIKSQASRSQRQNRKAALERLAELLNRSLRRRKPRKATRISRQQKQARLDAKRRRAETKKNRSRIRFD